MELGSHTFSHYYCLEAGQDANQFRADLEASIAATQRLGIRPISLVFPRNQYNSSYLATCGKLGFKAYRGNEPSWIYRESPDEDQSLLRRGPRLLDAYVNLSGDNAFIPQPDNGVVNVPSSRFLRPYSVRLRNLEWLRLRRIRNAMTSAARKRQAFHLWWHPHNFGVNLEENLAALDSILHHYSDLRDSCGMRSMNMRDLAVDTIEARRDENMATMPTKIS
jgi:hypothetical protein